jgi:hypothetical protein
MSLVHYYLMNRDLFSDKAPILREKGDALVRHFFHLVKTERTKNHET